MIGESVRLMTYSFESHSSDLSFQSKGVLSFGIVLSSAIEFKLFYFSWRISLFHYIKT